MRQGNVSLITWTFLLAVLIVALSLAATRPTSARYAGIAIVAASILCLASKLYFEAVALKEASVLTVTVFQKSGILLLSGTYATGVIGVSDLAFLTGYNGFLKIADYFFIESHWSAFYDPNYMELGFVVGMFLALRVTSVLRQTYSSPQWAKTAQTRRWLNLWPVGLVILIGASLGAEEMRKRYSLCHMMAKYHAGREAKADGMNKAALHTWFKQWYERAAIRPWLPIDPDHIPPELE